jgi:hypothetical protein
MERETKDLHLEIPLRIRSCARHTVKSRKKSKTMASRPIDTMRLFLETPPT